ncbi:hypothetical protein ACFSCX_03635 [Bacillus salitolerans]|uniref:Uncharacterized protein n=1 Tax=Bacillus salitolerans TaxID=1437434 RepID=A0ABW4LKS3_9BACI
MRGLVVVSIQGMIYSSFVIVEMLSHRDRLYAKALLFIVFFYLAFFSANAFGYSTKHAVKLTFTTLAFFFFFQRVFWWFISL